MNFLIGSTLAEKVQQKICFLEGDIYLPLKYLEWSEKKRRE